MNLLDKLRKPQRRHKRMSKKMIRRGYVALLFMRRQQMYLGWSGWEKKQFWHDFVRSPASRARTIVKGLEIVAPGTKAKLKG
jgi:hypothetical protein